MRRIGFNGLYGWLLSLMINAPHAGFALGGAALTAYDEFSKRGMNLVNVWIGGFIGGALGSMFDQTNSHTWAVNGAYLGVGLGFVKSYLGAKGKESHNNYFEALKKKKIDDYAKQKEELFSSTLEKLKQKRDKSKSN
jgi:hypothetical protein